MHAVDESTMGSRPERPAVAIWRNELLPLSETFIAEQARALSRYRPVFFGRQPAKHSAFHLEPAHTISGQGGAFAALASVWYSLTRQSGFLQARLSECRPALIHAHFGNQAIYALPFAQALGIPLITTFHGQDATRTARDIRRSRSPAWRLYGRHLRDLQGFGCRFIAVSAPIRDALVAQGFPPERTLVHHIGVDIDRFPARDSAAVRPPGRVLTVCRLVEKKGTDLLIRAVARLLPDSEDIELRIVGDGPLRETLERLAIQLGIAHRVHFLGSQPSEVVRRELDAATVFALPSVTAGDGSTEGLPISILEAMAVGLPVVSTWHAGIPEAVRDGETGLLVPERDVDALTQALHMIVGDTARARRLGQEGRARVESGFCLRTQSRALERIYDEACLEIGVGR